MKPIFQEKYGKGNPRGDCLRAALASYFELSLNQVPSFELMAKHEWKASLRQWLAERGDLLKEQLKPPVDEKIYLAIGDSPRGVLHCVINQFGKMIHDPRPDQSGLVNTKKVWLFEPIT